MGSHQEPVPYDERTPLMRLAGISPEHAAKRSLPRRFNQGVPEEPVVRRPGARFYVTARRGSRTAFLMGPFSSHMTAQMALPRARQLVRDLYPHEWIDSIGTASRPDSVVTVFGSGRDVLRVRAGTDRAVVMRGHEGELHLELGPTTCARAFAYAAERAGAVVWDVERWHRWRREHAITRDAAAMPAPPGGPAIGGI